MANATLPNPDTYLNQFSPVEANYFEVARDLYLAVLGAAVWDILIYVPEDTRILCGNFFSPVTWCFILSRVFAVAYVLLFVIMQAHPIANCHAAQIAVKVFCFPSIACTSFLFLQRLEVVYAENGTQIIQWVFCILWFTVSVGALTVVSGVGVKYIRGTGYCFIFKAESYAAVNQFPPAVFDTLVFFAISYNIISSRSASDPNLNWRDILAGKALPRLSRALLHGGQQYYFIVFGMNTTTGILLFVPSASVIYRPVLTLASMTLTASTACRVHRNLKTLNCDDELFTSSVVSHLKFAGGVLSSESTPLTITNPGVLVLGGPGQATKEHEPALRIVAPRHSWPLNARLRSDDLQAGEAPRRVVTAMLSV